MNNFFVPDLTKLYKDCRILLKGRLALKKIFQRFKISEWLIFIQIFVTSISLFFIKANSVVIDFISLMWNILNSFAIIIAFMFESRKNIKYHEVTSSFIFDELGESFASFMDFLMSDKYINNVVQESKMFREKIVDISRNGSYDVKRKISRALSQLYEIDKGMAFDVINILRNDLYKGATDIRRRTIEAVLIIIQKEPQNARKIYKKIEYLLSYLQYDDPYTIVACIETLYYSYRYIMITEKEKQHVFEIFETLKKDVANVENLNMGITPGFSEQMELIWKGLSALSDTTNVNNQSYLQAKEMIESILNGNAKFAKLAIVKNLFFTCPNYPICLTNNKCTAYSTSYMMDKIEGFLMDGNQDDIYLKMPTVRYFDCVCKNIKHSESGNTAKKIIFEYFTNENLLINKTAFDKFSKVLDIDRDFAKELLNALLQKLIYQADDESLLIHEKIMSLSDEKKLYFEVVKGRTKYKCVNNSLFEKNSRSSDEEINFIDELIASHHERIEFIGKIKSIKKEKKL